MRVLIGFILLVNVAHATTLKKVQSGYEVLKQDFSIEEVIEEYAAIKGYSLIVDGKLKGQSSLFGPKIIKSSELDLFVTSLLSDAGYSLLANDEIKQFEIIYSRDVRYKGGKVTNDINQVPENYNFYQFVMKLKYVDSHDIARNLRPFISRYGRVIDEKNANTIILADTGKNIHRIYNLIKKLDTPDFLKRKEIVNKINSEAQVTVQKNKSVFAYIKDQHVLFLIAFSLIGAIIGFGIRGYLMKRIEGGW